MSARDFTVAVADGDQLLAREWGPSNGFPVIAHHGTPSCRLDRPGRAADDRRGEVRLISFDRPGYGGSPARPGRDVAAAACDVVAIADALGLHVFAVYGVSGGGPHALACPALLGERVTRVAVSGWIDDDLALLRPWGFEPEEITVPVRLWQGDLDVLVPPAHSSRLAARIPTAELVQVPGVGHWLDAQHPDMLAWLTAR
jgi:pimeloyl-ACP methyl ester carboxylesterase